MYMLRVVPKTRVAKVIGRSLLGRVWRKPEFSALRIARLRKAAGREEVDAIIAEARPKPEPMPWSNK